MKPRIDWKKRLRRWAISLAILLLLTIIAALVGLYAVTRETYVRGPLLERLLGPRYARHAEIGHVELSLFPFSFRAYDVRVFDRRPAPGAPVEVLTVGKITIDGRWSPPRTLRLDKLEVDGLIANLDRDASGEWNVERVWADMHEGETPGRINARRLMEGGSAYLRASLDELRMGNGRLRIVDHAVDPDRPRMLDFDWAEATLPGKSPGGPLSLAAPWTARFEGYARAGSPKAGEWTPLVVDATFADVLAPSRSGVLLRGELKSTPLGWEPAGLDSDGDFPISQAVPIWEARTREAAPILRLRGSTARRLGRPTEFSNLELTAFAPDNPEPVIQLMEGKYAPGEGRFDFRLIFRGSPGTIVRRLRASPIPEISGMGKQLASDPLMALLPDDDATTPVSIVADFKATYRREIPPRDPWDTPEPGPRLDFEATLDARHMPAYLLGAPYPRDETHPARFRLQSTGHVGGPDLRLTVRSLDWRVFVPSLGAPADGAEDIEIIRGKTQGPPFVVDAASALQVWVRTRGHERRQSAETLRLAVLSPLASPVAQLQQILMDWRDLADAAGRPPIAVEVDFPPVPLAQSPWFQFPAMARVFVSGDAGGSLRASLFEKEADLTVEIKGELNDLRPERGAAPADATVRGSLELRENRLETKEMQITLYRTAERFCPFVLYDSWIDAQAGTGQVRCDLRLVDGQIIDWARRIRGLELTRWIDGQGRLLRWAQLGRGADDRAILSAKADLSLGERLDIRGAAKLEGLRLEATTEREASETRKATLDVEQAWSLDPRMRRARLESFSAQLTDADGLARAEIASAPGGGAQMELDEVKALLLAVSHAIEPPRTSAGPADGAPLGGFDTLARAAVEFHRAAEGSLPMKLPLQMRLRRVPLSRIGLLWAGTGIPAPQGVGDFDLDLWLLPPADEATTPTGAAATPPSGVGPSAWWIRGHVAKARLAGRPESADIELSGHGVVGPERFDVDDLRVRMGGAAVQIAGHYAPASGSGEIDATATGLDEKGLQIIDAWGNDRVAAALDLERRGAGGMLLRVADRSRAEFVVEARATMSDGGRRARLETKKTARGLRFSVEPETAYRLDLTQDVEFADPDRLVARAAELGLAAEGLASPVLTLRLPKAVELPIDLVRGDGSTTAVLALTGSADGAYWMSRRLAERELPYDARQKWAVWLPVQMQSWFPPGGGDAAEATFSSWVAGPATIHGTEAFSHALEGGAFVSEGRNELRDLRFDIDPDTPWEASLSWSGWDEPLGGRRGVSFESKNVPPPLMTHVPPPFPLWLTARTARHDLKVERLVEEPMRRYSEAVSLSARDAAICGRALSPGRSDNPLHPPISIEYNRATDYDLATSTVTLRALNLRAVAQDTTTTSPLVEATLAAPLAISPATLEIAGEAPAEGEPSPAVMSIRVGPVDLGRYGRALIPTMAHCRLSGRLAASADVRVQPTKGSAPQALLDATVDLRGLRVLPAGKESSAAAFRSLPARASGGTGRPADIHVDFALRGRAGSLALERFRLESPNDGWGLPPDAIDARGALYNPRTGLEPDVQVRGAMLNLTKYVEIVSDWLRARELADALPEMPALVEEAARVVGPPADDRAGVGPAPPRLVRTRIRFDLREMRLRGARWTDIGGLLRSEGGRFIADPFEARLGGGRVEATARLDVAPRELARYEARCRLDGVDLVSLLEVGVVKPGAQVTGRVTGSVDLAGQGAERDAVRRNIEGRGRLSITDGHLPSLGRFWNRESPIQGVLTTRLERGNLDFALTTDPDDPRNEVRLRGYVKDVFGGGWLEALVRARSRTQVGPRPPRETGRLLPEPQTVVGGAWRVSGPIRRPEQIQVQLETVEY